MNSRQHLYWDISGIQCSSPFLIRLTILHINHLKKRYKSELIDKSYFKYAFRRKKSKRWSQLVWKKKGNIIIHSFNTFNKHVLKAYYAHGLCSDTRNYTESLFCHRAPSVTSQGPTWKAVTDKQAVSILT